MIVLQAVQCLQGLQLNQTTLKTKAYKTYVSQIQTISKRDQSKSIKPAPESMRHIFI